MHSALFQVTDAGETVRRIRGDRSHSGGEFVPPGAPGAYLSSHLNVSRYRLR